MTVIKTARKPQPKPFKCMECGKLLTTGQAERQECPKCGGGDIDIA